MWSPSNPHHSPIYWQISSREWHRSSFAWDFCFPSSESWGLWEFCLTKTAYTPLFPLQKSFAEISCTLALTFRFFLIFSMLQSTSKKRLLALYFHISYTIIQLERYHFGRPSAWCYRKIISATFHALFYGHAIHKWASYHSHSPIHPSYNAQCTCVQRPMYVRSPPGVRAFTARCTMA